MENSEHDYWDFYDDIQLDAQTLREVDTQVQSYSTNASRERKSDSPPPKRLKRSHATSSHTIQRSFTNDSDDVPDITLREDGAYNVYSPAPVRPEAAMGSRVSGHAQQPHLPISSKKPVSHPTRVTAPRPQPVAEPSSRSVTRTASGPVFGSQHTSTLSTAHNIHNSKATPDIHVIRNNPSVNNTRSGGNVKERAATRPPAAVSSRPAPLDRGSSVRLSHSRTQQAQSKNPAERENDSLKRRLLILQAQLQDAQEDINRKNGEAKVIRDNWQLDRERYEGEIAKLKASKEAAEASKAQLQREQKDELERIRTSISFKQFDADAASFRRPMSTKKLGKQVNMTPVRVPDEMRAWSAARTAGPSYALETPRRPTLRDFETPSHMRQGPAPSQRLEHTSKLLPGFFNSFAENSPAKSMSQRSKNKGKGKARDEDVFRAPLSPPASPNRGTREVTPPPDQEMRAASPLSSPLFGEQVPLPTGAPQQEDVNGITASLESSTLQEQYSDIEPLDWRDTIRRMLFTHTLAPSRTPTLQRLFNSPIPSSASADDLQAYSSASAKLLESVAAGPDLADWQTQLRNILGPLSEMAALLTAHAQIGPLAALFHLLRTMSYTVPHIFEALVAPISDDDSSARILLVLRDVIQRNLVVEDTTVRDEETAILARETLALFEALVWTTVADMVTRFSVLTRDAGVLPTLLGPKQPTYIIRDTTRILAVLITYPNFFRQILVNPHPSQGDAVSQDSDARTIKYLDQLYSYLADSSREEDLKDAILYFITSAALAHADAVTVLLNSYILIPSIIFYLTEITNPLWEDDESLMASPDRVDWVLQMTLKMLSLLSYLIFASPTYNLRYRLNHIPIPRFNGIAHMFTVTMSRFAFADTPMWLSDLQRVRLEESIEMANRLLELVVDGPEAEVAWSTYQEDNESKQTETEEERQARLLHPEDDE